MSAHSSNPKEFQAWVIAQLKGLKPRELSPFGDEAIRVNGQVHKLDDIKRIINVSTDEAPEDLLEHYFRELLSAESIIGDCAWEEICERVMPRIWSQGDGKSKRGRDFAQIPFVNSTVIAFVIDFPRCLQSISLRAMQRWGVDVETLADTARNNLTVYREELALDCEECDDGTPICCIKCGDGYDSSRLWLPRVWKELSPHLGAEFFVAIPARDAFIAVSCSNQQLTNRLQEFAASGYENLPHPITPKLFVVARDGVAGVED